MMRRSQEDADTLDTDVCSATSSLLSSCTAGWMLCALVRHDSFTRGAFVKCVCRRNTQDRSNRHVGTVARGAASEGIKRDREMRRSGEVQEDRPIRSNKKLAAIML
jgi:hypothetical protein